MPKPPSSPSLRRLLACARAVLLMGTLSALVSGPAAAAPEVGHDEVARLLAEKGLIDLPVARPPSESAFVRQVQDKAADMVIAAMNFLGVRYRRGGSTAEAGFDCSGFTRHIFETSLGLTLPRRADEQASATGLVKVQRAELQPGDLVFFNTLKRTYSHVGIYIGEGRFIHSPRAGGEVRVEDMRYAYWDKRYTGARRAEQVVVAAAAPEAPRVAAPAAAPTPGFDSESSRRLN